jgi:hypothetical protein
MIRLLGSVLLALLVFSASPVRADLCQDSRIVAEVRQFELPTNIPFLSRIDQCVTKTTKLRDANGMHDVEIAWVLREAARDYDAVVTRYDAFALLPGNELLSLGRFRAVPVPSGKAMSHVLDALDINPASAGGIVRIPFDVFYDYALERRRNMLCVVYTMKVPFRGSFLDCNGYGAPIGAVGYAEGTISWDEAREISCRQLQSDTGKTCDTPHSGPTRTLLVRDAADGSLYWDTEVRSLVRVVYELRTEGEIPVHTEIHRYRVDLVGGKVTLLQHKDEPVPGEKR